jgi:hypothetical protein
MLRLRTVRTTHIMPTKAILGPAHIQGYVGDRGLNLIPGFITCYANLYVPRGARSPPKIYLSWFKGLHGGLLAHGSQDDDV